MDPILSQKVAEFVNITGASTEEAQDFLARYNGDLDVAVDRFLSDSDSEAEPEAAADDQANNIYSRQPPRPGQTLSGNPAPASAANMSDPSNSQNKPKKKFGSLRDFEGEGANPPPGRGEEDDDEKDQEFYTGGDKSGLAVQEPGSSNSARDPIQRLLDTARRNGPPQPREDEDSRVSNFSGRGQTLGGEDTPSRTVGDPTPQPSRRTGVVERTLHMWRDGFSVDDGQLYRYDDPSNARLLDMINRGSAPLEIMDVEQGQAVDVKVDVQRETDYVQPKKKYKPFSGQGQRLGSPGPDVPAAAPAPAASSTATQSNAPDTNADTSQPTIQLQVRLADGTRLPARFNATQTIGDVYHFVNRAHAPSQERSYSLATTFPTKLLDDPSLKLGDMAEFKKGGIVVQKWT